MFVDLLTQARMSLLRNEQIDLHASELKANSAGTYHGFYFTQ